MDCWKLSLFKLQTQIHVYSKNFELTFNEYLMNLNYISKDKRQNAEKQKEAE